MPQVAEQMPESCFGFRFSFLHNDRSINTTFVYSHTAEASGGLALPDPCANGLFEHAWSVCTDLGPGQERPHSDPLRGHGDEPT